MIIHEMQGINGSRGSIGPPGVVGDMVILHDISVKLLVRVFCV